MNQLLRSRALRLALVLVVLVAAASSSLGAPRVALVIGNSRYDDAPLANPANDAQAIGEALRRLGFELQGGKAQLNLGRGAMLQALRDFQAKASGSETALFYYAGHGVQVSGQNFLLPVGEKFLNEDDIKDNAIDIESVLGRLDSSGAGVKIVILDACRNMPLPRSTRGVTRGLARMEAPTGALIAFAAKSGEVAEDGNGRNGLYTKHILSNIETPGITINEMFHRVRDGVERESASAGRLQSPREEDSLKGAFFFVPDAAVAGSTGGTSTGGTSTGGTSAESTGTGTAGPTGGGTTGQAIDPGMGAAVGAAVAAFLHGAVGTTGEPRTNPSVVVPELTGVLFSQAENKLAAQGLRARRVDGIGCADRVLNQFPPAGQMLAAGQAVSMRVGSLPSGPDTCKPGYVWRDAFPSDHVCVTPAERDAAAMDTRNAAFRRQPGGGPFGADTCRQGLVWREGNPADRVCVPPETRTHVAQQNRAAASTRACSTR